MQCNSSFITAPKQNLTVLGVGFSLVVVVYSLGNETNTVTLFNLEFGWMHCVISLSSLCLFPEEPDLLNRYPPRPLGCSEM